MSVLLITIITQAITLSQWLWIHKQTGNLTLSTLPSCNRLCQTQTVTVARDPPPPQLNACKIHQKIQKSINKITRNFQTDRRLKSNYCYCTSIGNLSWRMIEIICTQQIMCNTPGNGQNHGETSSYDEHSSTVCIHKFIVRTSGRARNNILFAALSTKIPSSQLRFKVVEFGRGDYKSKLPAITTIKCKQL